MIRSLRSREKMSNARSPRGVCSTTIGISAIGYLLAAFASMIALCAAWQRHDTPASVGRSDKREHVYADTEEIPPSLFGKRAGYFAPFPAVQVSMVRSWSARRRSRYSGSRRMPRDSPIAPRMVLISLSDFLPKFLVLSRSDSVFCTSSAMVWICAVLRQLDARTDSSSSSTLRNRCSLTSRRTTGALDVRVEVKVPGDDRPRALHLKPQKLGPVDVHREHQLADVENDVEGVLPHTGQVRELVQYALDLDPGRRGAGNGGQQHPAVGVARGHGEARLEGLDHDLPIGTLTDEPVVTDRKG